MPIRIRSPFPEFPVADDKAAEWANVERQQQTPPREGMPTLVHFWAFGCETSRNSLPLVNRWRETYGSARGKLQVIGVHQPRSDDEKDPAAAKAAIVEAGVAHPVLIDGAGAAAKAFRNECVPAFYLFDEAGRLRHYQAGERGFALLERRIRRLIGTDESV